MFKTKIFNKANPKSITIAQRLTGLIWLQYLLFDNFKEIIFLRKGTFFNRGLYNFIGNFDFLFSSNFWNSFRILLFTILVLYILKLNHKHFFIFLVLIYFYEMFKKGFGGHIDHRITTLFLFTLILNISVQGKNQNTQTSLVPPVCFFFFQYTCIGLARLINGFPELFRDDIFSRWLIQRSMRPNYFELQFGQLLVENIEGIYLSSLFLILTFVELFTILLLFTGRKIMRYALVVHILAHLSIFILMGINFTENVLILVMLIYLDRENNDSL